LVGFFEFAKLSGLFDAILPFHLFILSSYPFPERAFIASALEE
jgi:hypothetical protein